MIIFTEIYIKGFGSIIEETIFSLNQPGLNIIRGKVGSGKTTIPSALSWCLFGQPLKYKSQISTWEEKRPDNWKGTFVEVKFVIDDVYYTICRGLDFKGKLQIYNKKVMVGNNLFMFVNGELDPTRNKNEKQKLIEKTLGYSFDLFKSSIIFGQKMKKIIEETGPQKKKIFEEAFEVAFIEDAKNNTKDELEKLKSAHLTMESTIDTVDEKIETNTDFYNEALKNEKDFKKNKDKEIKRVKKDIKEYKSEIAEIEETSLDLTVIPANLGRKIEKLEKKYDNARDNNSKLEDLLISREDLIDNIGVHKDKLASEDDTCPTCGSIMDKEGIHKFKKGLRKELKEYKDKLKLINLELRKVKKVDVQDIKDEIHDLRKEKTKIEKKVARVREARNRLPKLNIKIDKLNKELKLLERSKLTVNSIKYKKKLSKLEIDLDNHKRDRDKLSGEIELKDWLIKDPLSNNGLKAYIFSSMLNQVNQALEEYSRVLGFQVEFGIDLDTHRKDFYQAILFEGVISPYEDLSGGQKQLVDTAIAFAIHDVISKIRPTNILFMDEPFESLGVDEIDIIEELVENKSKDKSLFLITHHQSFTPRNVNDITVIRNEDGHSTII